MNDPTALCLDGSPYSYYISVGSDTTKFSLNHQGGGWCQDLNECSQRAQTPLGSSKTWTNTVVMGDSFSRIAAQNPLMANWTFVYLPYCDGGSFTGNNISTNPQLWFMGLNIRNAVVASLQANYGFDAATDIVVGGCSAGGLAAYLHVDYYAQLFPKATTRGMPDSGFFLDGNYSRDGKPDYEWRMSNLYSFMNSSASIIPACNQKLGYLCLFAYHILPFIQSPVFALNSAYDATMANGQCGHSGIIFNWNNVTSVNACGNYIRGLMKQTLAAPSGVFLDSCQHHCGEWGQIHIDNITSPFAVQTWYTKGASALPNNGYMDQGQPYPCSSCCNDK